MIIESIIIYDYINNKINKFDFNSRVNLFVSKTNTIGKSSLMKSIYYCLGYSIKIWPSEWDVNNMVFQLNVNLDSKKKHSITRHKDLFYIDGKKNILNEKEYSSWLQDLLNINIKIKDKQNKILSNVYASEVLLPFYVDQDKSWNGYLYSKTSDSYGRYSDTVNNVFNFYFDIINQKILDLEVEKSEFETKLKIIDKKIEGFELLEGEYFSTDNSVYITKLETLDEYNISENQLAIYLKKINRLNLSLAIIDQEIIEVDKKINIIVRDIAELEKLKKSYIKRFEDIKHTCIYCNSNLTEEQSLTRLKIRNNLFEISEQIDKADKLLKDLHLNRDNKIHSKNKYISKQIEIEDIINKKHEYKKIENFIGNLVQQELFNNYVSIEEKLKSDKNLTMIEISNIKKLITEEKKGGSQKRTEIRKKYNELINEYEVSLGNVKLDEIKFYDFKEVTGSGNNSNKKMLAIYTLYSNLMSEFSNVHIPFGMDSFIKNETSKEFKEQMFGFLSKHYLTLPNQIFFSIIDENLVYLNSDIKYNKIELERPILKEVNDDNKHFIELLNNIDR